MGRKNKPDLILLGISATLVFVGIFILASVSASFSFQNFGTTFYFLNHQILFGLLPGFLLGTAAFFMPLRFLKKISFAALLGNIILLMMVFLPVIGNTASAAHRWIFIGPISFQPSELLKLTLIVYIAAWLATKVSIGKQTENWKTTLLPFGIVIGIISLLLIFQPDISTLGVIGITAIIMYFSSATPIWHSLLMIGGGIATLIAVINLAPYRVSRLAVFFDPSLDPLGQGYQAKQALIGIGSGGITGVGLGLSFQKFGILPEPISDSIYAIFAEEAGLLGATFLVLLFLAFAWRGLVIARRSRDEFSKLVIVGITSWITIQAFVNMGSMVGILPLTGIPLPFISYGGSALVTELIALGILLNISKQG
ncbi:cell division protein FtsW [Patescibacteria group bacterium]|nr:cell division protein FtsW [Patescibacteria group bacterium]